MDDEDKLIAAIIGNRYVRKPASGRSMGVCVEVAARVGLPAVWIPGTDYGGFVPSTYSGGPTQPFVPFVLMLWPQDIPGLLAQEGEEYLRSLLECAQYLVYVCDVDGIYAIEDKFGLLNERE